MKKKILLFIMALGLFSGCKIDELEFFGEERFIYFPTINREHTINYTLGGLEEDVVKIPLRYSGRYYTENREYKIQIVQEEGTPENPIVNAEEGVEFSLPEKLIFRTAQKEQQRYADNLDLKVMKSDRMNTEVLNITLRLVSNENFTAAVRDSMTMNIKVTNMIAKPYWWTSEIAEAYLGEYSNIKYKLFLDNVYDGDYGQLEAGEQYYYALQFKKWLEENPHYENGKLITVPVIG